LLSWSAAKDEIAPHAGAGEGKLECSPPFARKRAAGSVGRDLKKSAMGRHLVIADKVKIESKPQSRKIGDLHDAINGGGRILENVV
jgi:hypothetical protein